MKINVSIPAGRSELMSKLTIELLILARDFNELNKKKQVKAINDTADKIFYIFRKNLIFRRKTK